MHDTDLIRTVALGLVFAWVCGMLAQKLRLSPLLGYLVAGVLLGPHTPGLHGDTAIAGQLAEIGVMLLMFGVGLHFSLADLWRVRAVALPGALLQIGVTAAVGAVLACWWGWSLGAGLVLGLALSVASTVVLLRAMEERGMMGSPNADIAVGWLIVEDLAMVLVLVLLPALASGLGGDAAGSAQSSNASAPATASDGIVAVLAVTALKVGAFVALMLLGGRRLVPWLLAIAARTGSRELFTLGVLALALGIAFGSSALFGVSFALGAFFAGVVLAESDLSHQAAAQSLPLQDAFAVLFFVSVGMLFDPSVLMRAPLAVLAVVLAIVVGKSLVAVALTMALGYSVRTALTVAASLAQIGEFSFILVGLGADLGLLPPEGRDLVLAGALISIALHPIVFTGASRLGGWLDERLSLRPRRTAESAPVRQGRADHAIVVGYGRVGTLVGQALAIWEMPFVVVERDRRLVERLRGEGIEAIYGDATAAGVLEAAGVARARLLIVTSPEGFQAHRVLMLAKRRNPEIDTVVRTHSEADLDRLVQEQVGLAVLGERELALRMTGYALRSMGLGAGEAQLYMDTARGDLRPGS